MELIGSIILSALDEIEYIIIANKLVSGNKVSTSKTRKILFYCITVLVFSTTIALSGMYLPSKYRIAILPGLIMIVLTFVVYRRKIKETIYIYGISTTIILLIQFCALVILKGTGKKIEYNLSNAFASHAMILPMTILVCRYLPINAIFNYATKDNKVFKYLMLNMFTIMMSLLLYWYIDINGVLKNIVVVTAILICITVVNFIIIKNGLRNKLKEQKLKSYEGYLPAIDELIMDLRKKQHKLDNHIQMLTMISMTDEEESVRAYIEESSND